MGAAGDAVKRPTEFVHALERGLAVLRVFSAQRPALTLSEVARMTDTTRATARRVLHTLATLGYVRVDGRNFTLTPRVLDLGYAYLSSLNLSDVAQPYMEALVEQVHESSSAAVLDGSDVVYVARVPTRRIMRITLDVGSRLPAHATSLGRVLLADLAPDALDAFLKSAPLTAVTERTVVDETRLRAVLAEVRAQGWCLLDQELEDGLRSIAAPICKGDGSTVAALNVSSHAGRVSKARLTGEVLPRLLETARLISAQLAKR